MEQVMNQTELLELTRRLREVNTEAACDPSYIKNLADSAADELERQRRALLSFQDLAKMALEK
jgi:hypothetical protein